VPALGRLSIDLAMLKTIDLQRLIYSKLPSTNSELTPWTWLEKRSRDYRKNSESVRWLWDKIISTRVNQKKSKTLSLYKFMKFMNGISCDECSAGYRPGMLADCVKCKGEYCDSCHRNHKCEN